MVSSGVALVPHPLARKRPLLWAARHKGPKRRRSEETKSQGSHSKRHKKEKSQREEDGGVKNRSEKPSFQKQREASTSGDLSAKRIRKACLEDLYEKGELLGSGGCGSVFAGTRKADGKPVAIKYVSKGSAAKELDIPGQGSMPLEVALMTLANAGPPCSNILQLYEWFDEPTRYIMILERPDQCQDLFDFREDRGGSLPESLARKVMLQLVNALRHCKSRGIVHRDVKPENLLIQKNMHNIKLIDFGCGTLLNTSAYNKFAGTRQYAPPEWFLEHQYLAEPATVWSVGVTLYELVCGGHLFGNAEETIQGHIHFTKRLSPACQHLIRWCLSTTASDRPSLEDIEHHPWFQRPGPVKRSAV